MSTKSLRTFGVQDKYKTTRLLKLDEQKLSGGDENALSMCYGFYSVAFAVRPSSQNGLNTIITSINSLVISKNNLL